MLIGVALLSVSAVLIASPLLLGRGLLNKYLVTIGLLGALTGASCILHALWDSLK